MTPPTDPSTGVWLRGNIRPVVVLAVLAKGALVVSLGLWAWWTPAATGPASSAFLAIWLAIGALVLGLMAAASRPRLTLVGDTLRVRLSPTRVDEVPLAMVECFFLGSQTLQQPGSDRADLPTHRVGTLVMRVAERAVDYQQRPTFAPWGTWAEGAIVFDGRWCEPLSVDLARRLSTELLAAKRAADASALQTCAGVGDSGERNGCAQSSASAQRGDDQPGGACR